VALLPADPKGRKQALLLIIALVGAAWYVGKMYVLDPRQVDIDADQAQLETLEAQNRRSRALAARRDDLSARMELQERQLRIFEELIPASDEVPELIDAISAEARLTGVDQQRVAPRGEEPGEFYTKRTWEYTLVGEYHDIGRCLARIASLPRIIKPSNLSIGLAPRSRATRDMVAALEVSMTIETFVLGGLTGQQPEGQGESPSG
jgi:Tfp pilus assembly protein PilO